MTIISISGLIGSGKDTLADYLIANHSFRKMSFASSLKDAAAAVFGWDRTLLEGDTPEGRVWRDTIDNWWATRLKMPKLTPRWVLQYWGTEVFRQHFHDDTWVASLEYRLNHTTDNIIITDCRFKNELNMINGIGGISIRVERGEKPIWYDHAIAFNKGPEGNVGWAVGMSMLTRYNVHASEYSSIGLKYSHIIQNDGTIGKLHEKVEDIISLQPNLRVSK
jgi:hypothetical protein